MTNAGIERTIPLAFFKLYDGVPNDNDLWQSMLGSVWSANVMFKAAHVQFYPAVVKDCPSPTSRTTGPYRTMQWMTS